LGIKYEFGDLVRITKEKGKFAKGYEQTFSTEIFRIVKVTHRFHNEHSDMQDLKITF